ncbi:MAG: Ig-like domain-containing protein [Actinomycetota bacterium]|nr:Ig-like domain-containing protein [Actinomycetota bacterium]
MQRFSRLVVAFVLAMGTGIALAAPASAAVTMDPVEAVGLGEWVSVTGTGCTPGQPVVVRIASTTSGEAFVEAAAVLAGAGGSYAANVVLTSAGSAEFVPGTSVSVGAWCTPGLVPGVDAPDTYRNFLVQSSVPPTVTLEPQSVPQRVGTVGRVLVHVTPAMSGSMTVTVGGVPLAASDESGIGYWLGLGDFVVPSTLPVGRHEVVVSFFPILTGEEMTAAGTFEVVKAPTTTTLTASASSWRYGGTRASVTATVSSAVAGKVEFTLAGRSVGTVPVVGGKASLRLPVRNVGRYTVVARFVPVDSTNIAGSTASRAVRVTKASAVAKIKAPKSVKAGKKASVTVRVKVKGVAKPTGKFAIYDGKKKVKTFSLKSSHRGKRVVKLKLKKGIHKLSVRYLGSKNVKADKSPKVKVRAR